MCSVMNHIVCSSCSLYSCLIFCIFVLLIFAIALADCLYRYNLCVRSFNIKISLFKLP
jgi:hypothetical protein